jgi:acyl-CoA dehydrogenase
MSNLARATFHGLTGARWASAPVAREEAGHYRQLTRMSAVLAVSSEAALLTLGGALKRKESLSARLGDVLSALYLASAALKRFADQGRQPADQALVEWAVRDALHRAQQSLFAVYDNFPVPLLGRAMKWVLFPYGAVHRPPSDALLQRAAKVVLRRGGGRDRLTDGLYLPDDQSEALAQLEVALETAAAAEPVVSLLRNAMRDGQLDCLDPEQCLMEAISRGVIDEHGAAEVRAAIAARRRVIEVDEFPAEYWTEERNSWKQIETPSHRAGQFT